MAESKKDKTRAKKAEKFKQEAKKAAAIAAVPKTHLVPQTEWQSNDNLDCPGHVAEAFEVEMVKAFEALQRAGAAFQELMRVNLESKKVKITYIWNNGEVPTPDEVTKWEAHVKNLQQQRAEFERIQNDLKKANETDLVTVGGAPLTQENLEREEKEGTGLIIVP